MKPTHRDPAGVIATLFNFSFTEFLTLKVVRLLYVVAVVGGGLAALIVGFAGFSRSFMTGAGTLLIAALVYLVGLALTRIWLEAMVVFFRLADSTAEVAEQAAQITVNTGRQAGQGPPVA